MKTFKVLLHRDYSINIDAKNEYEAKFLAEFFIAGEKDASTENEKAQHCFRINEIEMVTNDALEIEYVEEK